MKNGIEHLYEEKVLEVTLKNVEQKIEFQPEKTKRGFSVRAVEFFDEETKRKRLVYVYSPYEELKVYGLKFENKGKSVYKYTIDMIGENKKLYLEKKLFFDIKKAIEEIAKATNRKNVIFMGYNGELYTTKLELPKYFYRKIEEAPNFDIKKHLTSSSATFSYYLYYGIFDNNKTYKFLIENDINKANEKYPLIFSDVILTIKGGVDLYITPELYARNKSIFKDLPEIPAVNVTSTLLTRFKTQLNDPDFSASKIYGFKGVFLYSQYRMSYEDLIIPEFKASVKIKSPKKVNDVFKNTFESTYNLLHNKTYSSEKTSTPSSD